MATPNTNNMDTIHEKRMQYITNGISGLQNLGNSCYLNSILQCLSSLPLFRTWLLNEDNFKDKLENNKNKFKNESITKRLSELFNNIWCDYVTVSPKSIKTIMGQINDQFQNNEQQDSHEFLNCLLDTVHEEVCTKVNVEFNNIANEVMGYMIYMKFKDMPDDVSKYDIFMDYYNNKANEDDRLYYDDKLRQFREERSDIVEIYNSYKYWDTNDQGLCMQEKRDVVTIYNAYKYWKGYIEKSHSMVTNLFTGMYYSSVKCDECTSITDTFEPFTILTLPIHETQDMTLEDALKDFTTEEILVGDNQFHCTKCKKNVDAHKKMYIWELPKILIVQFKRFKHTVRIISPNYTSNSTSKISTKITFPFENLDLKPQMSPLYGDRPSKYNLVATSNHSGTTWNMGHYVSFCKNNTNNYWYKYDDDEVFYVPDDKIVESAMSKDTYILFYVKQ
jgi:ubiquitin C-terminal hydrolase